MIVGVLVAAIVYLGSIAIQLVKGPNWRRINVLYYAEVTPHPGLYVGDPIKIAPVKIGEVTSIMRGDNI